MTSRAHMGRHLGSRVYSAAEENMRETLEGFAGFRSDLLHLSRASRCAHLAAASLGEVKGQKAALLKKITVATK